LVLIDLLMTLSPSKILLLWTVLKAYRREAEHKLNDSAGKGPFITNP
jgi:hypothetical protein